MTCAILDEIGLKLEKDYIMIKVAVCGSNGKMGKEVVKAVNAADDMELVAQIDIFNGQFTSIKDAKKAPGCLIKRHPRFRD